MIAPIAHTKEWLDTKRREFPRRDPGLIERVIKALTLLEQLKVYGLKFTFKGGTSLLLLLADARRFSIDIDVVLPERPGDLAAIFDKIIQAGVFDRFEEDIRGHGHHVPKAHFKFFYAPTFDSGIKNPYILLDLLFEEAPYSELVDLPVRSKFTQHEGEEVTVRLPSADAILGDKLTAFAPTTTGILYGKNKELEIIKQLFDVSRLFDEVRDLRVVQENFQRIVRKELGYRAREDIDQTHVLDDCFEACVTLAFRGERNVAQFQELDRGVKGLTSYIFDGPFNIEEAIVCAAKAAYLSRLLKYLSAGPKLERFDAGVNLATISISDPSFKKLNKIKKFKPEGFFYWHKAIELHVAGLPKAIQS